MIQREMARIHTGDMIRAAERERLAKRTRRARGQSALRRVGGAVLSAILWPVRH
jgi:hypothetical protein